jgi:uncharacterized membrane protein
MRPKSRWNIASIGLRPAGSSCALAVAFVAACGGDSAEVRAPAAEEATLPGTAVDTLEGLLRVGEDGLTFQACGSGQESWVIESPGADLRVAADGLSVDAGAPIFARLVGGVATPPDAGPGSGHTSAIAVRQWVYLAEDTSSCPVWDLEPADGGEATSEGEGMPVLPPGVTLRALGNEPFWHVDVSPTSVRVGRLGFDDLGFPTTGPVSDNGARSWSGEADGHRFQLVVEQEECSDTMVDRTYPYTARLTLDEQELIGCALEAPGGP